MNLKDERLMETWRDSLEESVAFFSSGNKGGLEEQVCTDFLTNIGLRFEAHEVIPQTDDPPDVIFRGASFEVKEILDAGRRRHDEYRKSLAKAKAAKTLQNLYAAVVKEVTPQDITPVEIGSFISGELTSLAFRYEPQFRATLNLVFYVNLVSHILKDGSIPDAAHFAQFGWRSVSVLIGQRALVFHANSDAPNYLREKVGCVTVLTLD
jgi:Putative endonuclease, protein of unknown function (DUF1780)